MDALTLIIAVLGLVVATGSAIWQAATFVLEGGRVKLALQVGTTTGRSLITGNVDVIGNEALHKMIDQHGGTAVIAIEVRNVGRAPVTVQRWGVRLASGVSLVPLDLSIGEKLPYRLDGGEQQTWAMDLEPVVDAVRVAKDVFHNDEGSAWGFVDLGNGKTVRTRQSVSSMS